ncbi:MAG: rRNA maturation RNase YbeY [Gammaproteobacteria bacterium]|nr:rRNA maturation RNase YbeY [Gammaproteobacteria bacterium]MDE0178225.1 rRNA maturation RNase YbeY [Gammaproteobacteria bacterium]MDE0190926.1 rRNA maturation RNase YbeY [Gammaproteobacteria bacterium]
MTVDVQIAELDGTPAPPATEIVRWAVEARGEDTRSLCLRVVDQAESAALNARFRDRDKATNVLAFPADEPGILGDIAICAPVAALEAREQDKALADHYAHLVVHGVLHLLGHDHDTPVEAADMESREIEVLGRFGIVDPYGDQT